ncbi:MAG: methionine adenosyltransferase [Chloroflexota bacterium]
MDNLWVERLDAPPVSEQPIEIVERKGIGHPDTICDGIMEEVSRALCQEYRRRFGFIPHYNADKGLLIAGAAQHRLGGGQILKPMRFIFGDRATFEVDGQPVAVDEIAIDAASRWLKGHLPHLDPQRHLLYEVDFQPGSQELAGIFRHAEGPLKANDTSAAVGYAPLTETERLVLEAEGFLNSPEFKKQFPETGQDVKVMGFRVERTLHLTVAMPFIDRYVDDEQFYFRRKAEVAEALQAHIDALRTSTTRANVYLNTLDEPGQGVEGMYLSVLGTSAEDGDSGQVGRGNRVNGIIPLHRPSSAEAAAGKNPISHPGKVYNLLSHRVAARIYQEVPGLREVYVWLCSQIGRPIDQPLVAATQLILEPGTRLQSVSGQAKALIEEEFASIGRLIEDLIQGKYRLY